MSGRGAKKDNQAFAAAFADRWELASDQFIQTPYGLQHVIDKLSTTASWSSENDTDRSATVTIDYKPRSPLGHVALAAAARAMVGEEVHMDYCNCDSILTIVSATTGYNQASSGAVKKSGACRDEYKEPDDYISPIGLVSIPELRLSDETGGATPKGLKKSKKNDGKSPVGSKLLQFTGEKHSGGVIAIGVAAGVGTVAVALVALARRVRMRQGYQTSISEHTALVQPGQSHVLSSVVSVS